MSVPRTRGVTLLEAICGASLSLLLLSVVASVVIPSFKAAGQLGARVTMQQQASIVLLRLSRELQRVRPSGLAYWEGKEGSVISLHPVEGVSLGDPPQGIYSRQVIFYAWSQASGRLQRAVWPADPAHPLPLVGLSPPDGTLPLQPEAASLKSVLGNALPGQQLSDSLELFQVTSPGAELTSPLTLRLDLARTLPGRSQPTRLRLTQVVSIRCLE